MSANDQEEGDRSLIDGQFEMLPLLLLLLLFMQEGASRQVEWIRDDGSYERDRN